MLNVFFSCSFLSSDLGPDRQDFQKIALRAKMDIDIIYTMYIIRGHIYSHLLCDRTTLLFVPNETRINEEELFLVLALHQHNKKDLFGLQSSCNFLVSFMQSRNVPCERNP